MESCGSLIQGRVETRRTGIRRYGRSRVGKDRYWSGESDGARAGGDRRSRAAHAVHWHPNTSFRPLSQPGKSDPETPLRDLVVEIKITDTIKINPASGLSTPAPLPLPIGFQINGYSPWCMTIRLSIGYSSASRCGRGLIRSSLSRSCGRGSLQKTRTLRTCSSTSSQSYDGSVITLPDDLTIPKGWTIRFQFEQQADGTITGFACTVKDEAGNTVGYRSAWVSIYCIRSACGGRQCCPGDGVDGRIPGGAGWQLGFGSGGIGLRSGIMADAARR